MLLFAHVCVSCSVVSDSLRPHGLQATRLPSPWNSPGETTGVGSHSLLWGIFRTQGSNPRFLHYRLILYLLSHQGSPSICVIHKEFRTLKAYVFPGPRPSSLKMLLLCALKIIPTCLYPSTHHAACGSSSKTLSSWRTGTL